MKRKGESPATPRSAAIWTGPALLVLAGVAAYANSLHAEFVFDDGVNIIENDTIRDLWPPSTVLFPPPQALTVVGRPLLNLSLALNYAANGLDPRGYHVANIAIHLAAGLLFFELVRLTLSLPGISPEWRSAAARVAFAAALLWTVHPLQTESVTYIVQRAESLMGMFFLATLVCVARSAVSLRPRFWHAGAAACCLLGALCKETIVAVVPVAVLYDRIFLSLDWKTVFRERGLLHGGLAISWPLVGGLLATTEGRGDSAGFGLGLSAWEYARMQMVFVPMYLKLSAWPHPLVIDYGTNPILAQETVVAGAAALLAVLGGTAWALWRRPPLGFLGAACFLVLAPTSSIVPLAGQVAAERRMYLPLAAVTVLGVVALEAAARRTWGRRPRGSPTSVVWMVIVALAAAGICRTRLRNADYADPVRLWADTVRHQPDNARAWYNLGNEQLREGEPHEAKESFDKAVELAPGDPRILSNRSNVQLRLKHYAEAMDDCRRALAIEPRLVPALFNLAECHTALGQHIRAVEAYDRIIPLTPLDPEVYYFRGLALQELGRHAESIQAFSRSLEISEGYLPAWKARAVSWKEIGRQEDALSDLQQYLRLGGEL